MLQCCWMQFFYASVDAHLKQLTQEFKQNQFKNDYRGT